MTLYRSLNIKLSLKSVEKHTATCAWNGERMDWLTGTSAVRHLNTTARQQKQTDMRCLESQQVLPSSIHIFIIAQLPHLWKEMKYIFTKDNTATATACCLMLVRPDSTAAALPHSPESHQHTGAACSTQTPPPGRL